MSKKRNNTNGFQLDNEIHNIAKYIIFAYIIFFAISLAYSLYKDYTQSNTTSLQLINNTSGQPAIIVEDRSSNQFGIIEKVSATFGAIVAIVIGYYFGNKPVERLTEQVETETRIKNLIARHLEETSRLNNNNDSKLAESEEKIKELQDLLYIKDLEIGTLNEYIENLENESKNDNVQ